MNIPGFKFGVMLGYLEVFGYDFLRPLLARNKPRLTFVFGTVFLQGYYLLLPRADARFGRIWACSAVIGLSVADRLPDGIIFTFKSCAELHQLSNQGGVSELQVDPNGEWNR